MKRRSAPKRCVENFISNKNIFENFSHRYPEAAWHEAATKKRIATARRRSSVTRSNDNRKINQVRVQLSSALAKVASKVAQVSDLEAILAHTQDDREASEALVKIFAEKLKAAAAEKKKLKEELAALENTVCELEDRLDAGDEGKVRP